MKTCVFAGSFDPFTLGHKAVVDKLLNKKRNVIITVGDNPEKAPFFTPAERAEIIKAAYEKEKRVKVVVFGGDLAAYKKMLERAGASEYYRGIRDERDLEYEKKAEEKNKEIYQGIETKYVIINRFYGISSTFVKERLKEGLDVKKYIPKKAYPTFMKILKEKQKGEN